MTAAGRPDEPAAPETRLAAWIAGLERAALPDPVVARVKLLLLDAIASACAGRTTADRSAMEAVAGGFGGAGDATVIGGGTLSPAAAVLLNAYQVTAATVCDVHRPTLCHVTPVVVPPALAVAEARGSDGPSLLAALAAGLETTVRVGLATDYPVLRAHGWHAPGVTGPFGGAAAVSRLLGLDGLTTRNALGLAGSQAAGTFAGLGTSQVKFHQARGAVSGLLAALVAERGFDASPRILTAEDGGLFATHAEGGLPERLTDGLGERWELLDISLRRWPAASSLQAVVAATLDLVRGGEHPASAVRMVRIGLPEGSYRLNGEGGWADQLSAFQSARYVASVVVHDHECWLDQYRPQRLADPNLDAFARARARVAIEADLPEGGATVTLEDEAGGQASRRVEVPPGDPRAPLGFDDVVAKLGQAAAGGPLAGRVDDIVTLVAGLDVARSVTPLVRLLRA